MSNTLDRLSDKADKLGWNLRKIQNGKYMLWQHIDDDIEDEKEYRFSLKDVGFFLKELEERRRKE